jgi:O-antigen/teichoic acid export membrane protein
MKTIGLKHRIVKGISANLASQITNAAIQLVSLPIFLKYWGTDLYGEWLILSSIPIYLSMSDIGFGVAAANEMTMKIAQDKEKEALSVFQSIWLIVSITSIIFALIAILGVNFIPLKQWLNISRMTNKETVIVFSLLIIHVLAGIQASFLTSGFRCEGNYAIGVHCYTVSRFCEYLVLLLAVTLGANPPIAALSFMLTRIFFVLIVRAILKYKSPWIIYGYKYANVNNIKKLTKPALASMGFPLSTALSNQGSLIIIGSFFNPSSVVVFSVLRTVSRIVIQLIGIVRNTISPEISSAYGKRDLNLVKKIHRNACQISFYLALSSVLILVIKGDWLLKKWTVGQIEIDLTLFYLFLLIIIVSSLWYVSITVLTATNNHEKVTISYLVINAFSLALAVLLIPIFDIKGMVLSLLIAEISIAFIVISNSLKMLNESFLTYIKMLIMPSEVLIEAKKALYLLFH